MKGSVAMNVAGSEKKDLCMNFSLLAFVLGNIFRGSQYLPVAM